MNCPACNAQMLVRSVDRAGRKHPGMKVRRWRCSDAACIEDVRELVALSDRLPPRRGERLTDAQVEWILTTNHRNADCGRELDISQTLVSRIRAREFYCSVRPDLPRWKKGAAWLQRLEPPGGSRLPPPGEPAPAARPTAQRHCLDCKHYGGLSSPCLRGHAAERAEHGMRAAVTCVDWAETVEDEKEEEEA